MYHQVTLPYMSISRKVIYLVQTNLSVQTMQTSICTTGSSSNGCAGGVGVQICKSVITQSKDGRLIVKLPNLPYPLDVDPVVQIEVCIICTERLVCT